MQIMNLAFPTACAGLKHWLYITVRFVVRNIGLRYQLRDYALTIDLFLICRAHTKKMKGASLPFFLFSFETSPKFTFEEVELQNGPFISALSRAQDN
jgi:hypothetical protein